MFALCIVLSLLYYTCLSNKAYVFKKAMVWYVFQNTILFILSLYLKVFTEQIVPFK